MAKKRRRIFNYRPLAFAALALIAGILVGEALYGEHLGFIAIPLGVGAIALTLLLIFAPTRKFFYIPLALMVGFAAVTASNAVYDGRIAHLEEESSTVIYATVCSEIKQGNKDGDSGYGYKFKIKDIYIDEEPLEYDGVVYTYFTTTPQFGVGDVVRISANFWGTAHEKFGGDHAYVISDGTGYTFFAQSVWRVAESKLSFPNNLQVKIKQMYYERMSAQNAQIAAALVLGDKFSMDPIIKKSVSASGLSHVLAVSGLHITTIATALYFVLKKLKIKPAISLGIVTVATFLYALLCSFTSSALRAFVMSGVFNAASTFGKKRDNLSALSLAAILILMFRPTALFEIGFLLSFSSMLGIFMFYKSFSDVANKIVNKISPKHHFGKRAAELCCVTLSATAMSYPFIAYYFNEIPIFQFLSNIVFVPYIIAVYVILIVLTAFALITTLSPVLIVADILIFPFREYVLYIGGLSFSAIRLPAMSEVGIALYQGCAVTLSRFNLTPRRYKLRAGLIMIAVSIAIVAALYCVPIPA